MASVTNHTNHDLNFLELKPLSIANIINVFLRFGNFTEPFSKTKFSFNSALSLLLLSSLLLLLLRLIGVYFQKIRLCHSNVFVNIKQTYKSFQLFFDCIDIYGNLAYRSVLIFNRKFTFFLL